MTTIEDIPFDKDTEETVLATMMQFNLACDLGLEELTVDDFHIVENRKVFQCISALAKDGIGVSLTSVYQKQQDLGHNLKDLVEVIHKDPEPPSEIGNYIRRLIEFSMRRKLIEESRSSVLKAKDLDSEIFQTIDDASTTLFQITDRRSSDRNYDGKRLAEETMVAIGDSVYGNEEKSTTGFDEMDKYIEGSPGDYIVIAARPSMGKTALMLSMMRQQIKRGLSVGIYSAEMNARQIGKRLIAQETYISSEKMKKDSLTPIQLEDIHSALNRLKEWKIGLNDGPMPSISRIRSVARNLKRKYGIRWLYIDYLQLLTADAQNREREISLISSNLKAIALDLDITVVALAQLNRAVDTRVSKAPVLSDLRESGSIEQDADVIMFPTRPEYYGVKQDKDGGSLEGIAEINIAKNRNGPTGSFRMAFKKEIACFMTLEKAPRWQSTF
ncbi:MAG: replicative DNA helicase [Candidatus Kapaibacteriales bacterium]